MRSKLLAIVACFGILFVGASSAAVADPGDGPYRGGSSFVDNTLGQQDIYTGTWDYLLKTNAPLSVWTATLNDSVVTEAKLAPAVRTKLNAVGTGEPGPKGDTGATGPKGDTGPAGPAASDVKGSKGPSLTVAPTALTNIGGTFSTRATLLGHLEMPAGDWAVNTAAWFDRTTAAASGDPVLRPQLAVRIVGVADNDAGTVMGVALPPVINRELTGSAVQFITIPEGGATINVLGFGYNDNGSDAGSGVVRAAAKITTVRN